MRPVIYLDILLAVNFILDFFLLLAAGKLCGGLATKARVVAAAGVASLFSMVLLLPPLPTIIQVLIKFAGSSIPVLIGFQRASPRQTLKRIFWFFSFNLLLAGAVFFWCITLSPTGIERNNLAVYFNLSPITLILSVFAVYLVFCLIDLVFGRPAKVKQVSLSLKLRGSWIQVPAMLDTGMSLKDPLTGTPCLLLSYPQVRDQLTDVLRQELDAYFSGNTPGYHSGGQTLRVIPCRTAAGEELLPAYRCEECRIAYNGREMTLQKVAAAFARYPLQGQPDGGLVGPELVEPIL